MRLQDIQPPKIKPPPAHKYQCKRGHAFESNMPYTFLLFFHRCKCGAGLKPLEIHWDIFNGPKK